MKILVLSKYSRKGASSRYRMFQYFPSLEARGVELTTAALFDDVYLDRLYSRKSRLWSVLMAYFLRVKILLQSEKYDVLWVEKELFPWCPWFFEMWFFKWLRTPYIVDYDDAIFHQYDTNSRWLVRRLLGNKCDQVMLFSKVVVAGNEYLAARARAAGSQKVCVVPTVVSAKVFTPKAIDNAVPVIGWIGSMSTATYLEKLRPVLAKLREKYEFRFRVVGATLDWSQNEVECIPWSEAQEVALVQSFDIGVMPLQDSPWERGKCGFKLIQYMACGKPVVADPVGVNAEIVLQEQNGFLAVNETAWYHFLEQLLIDGNLRLEMGRKGRNRFEEHYCLERWQDFLFNLLRETSNKVDGADV